MLISRFELACTSDLVRLDGVPADALIHLTTASEVLKSAAVRTLAHIDPKLARSARNLAELAQEGVEDEHCR